MVYGMALGGLKGYALHTGGVTGSIPVAPTIRPQNLKSFLWRICSLGERSGGIAQTDSAEGVGQGRARLSASAEQRKT